MIVCWQPSQAQACECGNARNLGYLKLRAGVMDGARKRRMVSRNQPCYPNDPFRPSTSAAHSLYEALWLGEDPACDKLRWMRACHVKAAL